MAGVNQTGAFVSDRCVVIESDEDFEAFLDDPAKFLRDLGALEGLPEFNGVINAETTEQRGSLRAEWAAVKRDGHRHLCSCHHIKGPVPNFCGWKTIIR